MIVVPALHQLVQGGFREGHLLPHPFTAAGKVAPSLAATSENLAQ